MHLSFAYEMQSFISGPSLHVSFLLKDTKLSNFLLGKKRDSFEQQKDYATVGEALRLRWVSMR